MLEDAGACVNLVVVIYKTVYILLYLVGSNNYKRCFPTIWAQLTQLQLLRKISKYRLNCDSYFDMPLEVFKMSKCPPYISIRL